MSETLLKILNLFFFGFHTVLILFNIFGWLVPRWRLANFITLSLTAFSWFVLGIWYGWGYCFCTDWHWQVREMLGYENMSSSYIHFLILEMTGINFPADLVDAFTVILFFAAFVISAYLNFRKWRGQRSGN
jgi:hypothetical protein